MMKKKTFLTLLVVLLGAVSLYLAATPGLPFTELFLDTDLRDGAQTVADWSPREQALLLSKRSEIYGAFGPGLTGSDITADNFSTNAVALGDVDGDGDLDLVAATFSFADPNRLYLNNGTADPWNGVTGSSITTDAFQTASVALGDVDGDGDLDLVAGNDGGLGIPNRLYLNNGTANPWNGVTGTVITADADETRSVVLGDVDGDGDLDLIAGNDGAPNRLYLNNGTADPWNGVSGADITADLYSTWAVALGDVDGDGDLDLVAGNFNEPNRLYLNNGTLNPWNGVTGADITADADENISVALGDVDGDGDLDLVAGNNDATPDRLYLNNGTVDPWNGVTGSNISADVGFTKSVALGDLDKDGDLDLVTGSSSFQPNHLYLNNGTADPWNGVSGVDLSADTDNTLSVALGDVDGDGDLDLVAGNSSANRLYLNDGVPNPWNGVAGSDITSDAGSTRSIAVGDVDGDGDLDLVAGNRLNEANRLYLNNGTPDPWNGVSGLDITADSNSTMAMAMADVDGDGDLDLVAGNSLSPNRLYLNNGMADPWNGVTGSDITTDVLNTFAVALGDVDGDGDLDLVTGQLSATNRLYLNNGTANPWSGVAGRDVTADFAFTFSIVLGDVDGDGDLDLVVGNFGLTNRLYLNNGTADPWNGVTGTDITADADDTSSIVLGDVDSDGDLDLVASRDSWPPRLYLNNGTANPWNGVSGSDISTDTIASQSLRLGDVDGDGDLDLVAVSSGDNRLYLNNGTSDPWSDVSGIDITADFDSTTDGALADVDGDGDLDLVAGNDTYQINRLYLNGGGPGAWNIANGTDISTDAGGTYAVALGDVDGDGDVDLVAGNGSQPNRRYLNNGTADPWNGVAGVDVTADAGGTFSVALGDVDGDGDLDLVAGNTGQSNRLYLNNGTADPWNGVTGVDITTDADSTWEVALGDVDGDGDLDLVAGNYFQPNRLYLNNGTANPWNGVTGSDITSDANFTRTIALGDVDGDGDLDLVDGNDSGNRLRLYLNNGTADPWNGVTGVDISNDGITEYDVSLGDVDGDGDLDLVTASRFGPNRLYLNDGVGDPWDSLSTGVDITADADTTNSVALLDLDGDGDLDLVAGNDSQPNRLYLNNGTTDPWNSVSGVDITADTSVTWSVALADLNRDGLPDLVAGNVVQTNRLYRPYLYATARGGATSLRVDTELDPITNATLTVVESMPTNAAIDYLLSNDGGARWHLVTPGVPFSFPSLGTDLRWRAELRSLSPALTPRVEQLDITTQFQPVEIGDRVWDDLDADGIQDGGEPGLEGFTVLLFDGGGVFLDSTSTDASGDYSFGAAVWGNDYLLRFLPPPGFVLSPVDQGGDDALDSDVDPVGGATPVFKLGGFDNHVRWDAGMVRTGCSPPDQEIDLLAVTLSTDGSRYPILHFQDANLPTQVSGYNIYRASDPALMTDPSSLFATDIIDMDEATPDIQWIDSSGDVSPTGIWYFRITAYNNFCPAGTAEGPF